MPEQLWGGETAKAVDNFPVSGEPIPAPVARWLGRIKAAAARVNAELGLLDGEKAERIAAAGDRIANGELDDQFPIDVFQTGSGTSSNMNANEVLATLAGEGVHANDDVNMGQSSNDVFPTAMHVAAALALDDVAAGLDALKRTLAAKSDAFKDIVKIGRTHLQDATPLTLGQEFSGYVAQLGHAAAAIDAVRTGLYELALGGTAVGTGLNTHPEFAERVCQSIARDLRLPFKSAPNKFAALGGHEALAFAHGALKTLAAALFKIASDIRLLASGPRSGLGELSIPENEPGSSIMPGKVNPTQAEALTMLCAQVMGNDVALGFGAASGHLELNVFKPMIIHAFLQSARLLADGCRSFEEHCARGIEPNATVIRGLVERSLMLVTALSPHIGYDKAAEIAKRAHKEGKTLREVALALGYVSAQDFDRWVRAEEMIRPK